MTCPNCVSENVREISKILVGDREKDFCTGLLCGSLCFPCSPLSPCSTVSGKVTSAVLWICDNCGRKFK